WPGNVRELKNVVERSVCRADSITIDRIEFDPFASPFRSAPGLAKGESAPASAGPAEMPREIPAHAFDETVRRFESDLLRRALDEAKFNQRKAAASLGLTYHRFRGLYRKYRDD